MFKKKDSKPQVPFDQLRPKLNPPTTSGETEVYSNRRVSALEPSQAEKKIGVNHITFEKDGDPALLPKRSLLSEAGQWASRPQTAMAAVFVLMIGSSAFLLRNNIRSQGLVSSRSSLNQTAPLTPSSYQPGGNSPASWQTRRVIPYANDESSAITALGTADRTGETPGDHIGSAGPQTSNASSGEIDKGVPESSDPKVLGETSDETRASLDHLSPYHPGRGAEHGTKDEIAAIKEKSGSEKESSAAALAQARTIKSKNGCSTALARFEFLAMNTWGQSPGYDATLEAGICHRQLGHYETAMQRFQKLFGVPHYDSRARLEVETTKRAQKKQKELEKNAQVREYEKKTHLTPEAKSGSSGGSGQTDEK